MVPYTKSWSEGFRIRYAPSLQSHEPAVLIDYNGVKRAFQVYRRYAGWVNVKVSSQ